jgi:hypothetical protein
VFYWVRGFWCFEASSCLCLPGTGPPKHTLYPWKINESRSYSVLDDITHWSITGLSSHRKDAPNSGLLLNEIDMFRRTRGGGVCFRETDWLSWSSKSWQLWSSSISYLTSLLVLPPRQIREFLTLTLKTEVKRSPEMLIPTSRLRLVLTMTKTI